MSNKSIRSLDKELKEILGSHYSQILSELEEIINTDKINLSMEITGEGFDCKLG